MPALLTIPEAAARLKLCERMVWRLIKRGQLIPIRLGERATRLDPDEVERFIKSKTERRRRCAAV